MDGRKLETNEWNWVTPIPLVQSLGVSQQDRTSSGSTFMNEMQQVGRNNYFYSSGEKSIYLQVTEKGQLKLKAEDG